MSEINYPKAIKTLSALADGVDPQTGELLYKNHVFDQPDIIRALFAAIESLKSDVERQTKRRSLPPRAGQPWTENESDELRKRHQEGIPIKEIAHKHQRTKGAIESQLEKLGLFYRD